MQPLLSLTSLGLGSARMLPPIAQAKPGIGLTEKLPATVSQPLDWGNTLQNVRAELAPTIRLRLKVRSLQAKSDVLYTFSYPRSTPPLRLRVPLPPFISYSPLPHYLFLKPNHPLQTLMSGTLSTLPQSEK